MKKSTQTFDEFLRTDYTDYLCKYRRKFGEKADDFASLAIIKIYARIEKGGVQGGDWGNYLFIVLRNLIYNDAKKKRIQITDTTEHLKDSFVDDAEESKAIIAYKRQQEKDIDIVFSYVESNYTPIKAGLFKFYHKTKLTYQDISNITGFSFSYVWKINNEILKDLKQQFKNE